MMRNTFALVLIIAGIIFGVQIHVLAQGTAPGSTPSAPSSEAKAPGAAPAPQSPASTDAAPVSPTASDSETAAPTSAPTATPTTATPGAAPVPEAAVTTSAAVSPPPQTLDPSTYAVRLRDLEQRVNQLKDQVFRSKARLSLLSETVLQGVVAGSQAVIVHENKMSDSFQLIRAVYALDGAPIFTRADEEGALSQTEKFEIYNGSIVPGEHTLTVSLEYRGHGYGVFSYLKGYRFKVRSSYSFSAPESKAVTLRVVGYEKGGPTAPLEDRPAVQYIQRDAESREVRSNGTTQTGTEGGP